MRLLPALSAVVLAGGVALAQQDDSTVAFEAASIKPFQQGQPIQFSGCQGGPGGGDPARIDCQYVTLKMLVMRAYKLKAQEVFGPNWMEDQHFNIMAKVPAGTKPEQVTLMFRNLLAERFKVVAHRERRPLAVYALTVSKNGLKIHESVPAPRGAEDPAPAGPPPKGDDGFPIIRPSVYAHGPLILYRQGKARLLAGNTTLAQLAETLSSQLDRVVIDETGLAGKYDMRLDWTPEASQPGGRPQADAAMPEPDLFVALEQQLGVKVVSKKSEREALVVDRAERNPTEN